MGFKRRPAPPAGDIAGTVERLRVLVPQFYEAEQDYCRRAGIEGDETFAEAVSGPAAPAAITALEASLGLALPPSYRAFLTLFDGGYFGFGGGAKLLGTADHTDPHIERTLSWKKDMFNEFEESNPMDAEFIPLLVGDSRNMVLLEPPVQTDGEMVVVTYYLTGEEDRHANLVEFFESHLKSVQERG